MTISNAAILRMLASTLEKGGGTFMKADGSAVELDHSYAVAINGGRTMPLLPDNESLGTIVNRFQAAINVVMARHHPVFIGTWIDADKIYIDAVMIIIDRDDAMRLAKQQDQKAIYDFASGQSVYLSDVVTDAPAGS